MTAEGTSTLREAIAIAAVCYHVNDEHGWESCSEDLREYLRGLADAILSVLRVHLESRAEELVEAAASALHTELIHPHSAPWGDNYWSSTLDANSCHKVAGRALSAFSRALLGVPTPGHAVTGPTSAGSANE